MVTSVSALLKTVHSVEDEASRGVRAIESTVDAIKEAIVVSKHDNKLMSGLSIYPLIQ